MNTAQLWKCVKQDERLRRQCIGIYACNTVPTNFDNLPACYIMNTKPISQQDQIQHLITARNGGAHSTANS